MVEFKAAGSGPGGEPQEKENCKSCQMRSEVFFYGTCSVRVWRGLFFHSIVPFVPSRLFGLSATPDLGNKAGKFAAVLLPCRQTHVLGGGGKSEIEMS